MLPGSRSWSHPPDAGADQVWVVEANAKKDTQSLQETQRIRGGFCLIPSSHLPNSNSFLPLATPNPAPSSGYPQPGALRQRASYDTEHSRGGQERMGGWPRDLGMHTFLIPKLPFLVFHVYLPLLTWKEMDLWGAKMSPASVRNGDPIPRLSYAAGSIKWHNHL